MREWIDTLAETSAYATRPSISARLNPMNSAMIRAPKMPSTEKQPLVAHAHGTRSGRRAAATAPVNIFYVVDIAKYSKAPFQEPGLKDPDVQKSYYYVATGLIAQNVYLFAASQGLAAHFHNCDKQNTAREFKLRPEQRVLFAQTVGRPAED